MVSSRVDSYSKKEAATPTCSGEGAGVQEAKGQTIQPQQTNGTSGQGMEGTSDRSDRPEQPVRPVEVSAEQKAELAMPVSVPCDGETPLAFSVRGNEELVDHEATPKAQQYGAQRHLSTRGVKYWEMIIYLMKFLCNRSVCKGLPRL